MPAVDIVVVSYNSRTHLRSAVEPLAATDDLAVFVVDNESTDGSLDTVRDLPLHAIENRNDGFGAGCNRGAAEGSSPYILFLNPDATIAPDDVRKLAALLDEHPEIGGAGPRINESDGELDYSIRRFPRLRSTYARALFVHRFLPQATWTDEVVREREPYAVRGPVEWVSGACLFVRRSVFDAVGGFDERFFMYCEDKDVCKRIWDAGAQVWFEPDALCVHVGGASAPRAELYAVLASSRARYAAKHMSVPGRLAERGGIALHGLTHLVLSKGGLAARKGHFKALATALGAPPGPPTPSARQTGANARLSSVDQSPDRD